MSPAVNSQHHHPGDSDESVSLTVMVTLASATYPVHIGRGLLSSLGNIVHVACPQAKRVLLVQDSGVPSSTRLIASHALASDLSLSEILLDATEAAKSVSSLERIWEALCAARLDRDDVVVALGGGIITDVAGFAAATYRRGVPIIQCPTTLLSMVDASVGGKTGINLATSRGILKNMAGSFHQPAAVVADLDTLRTLPPREFRAGWAEVIKHALIERTVMGSSTLVDAITTGKTLAADAPELAQCIASNIRIKAAVVAADERETAPDAAGGRALLNLGHTFAHAIEPLPELSPTGHVTDAPLKHGEAVGLGLVAASSTALHQGLINPTYHQHILGLIRSAGLPVTVRGLPDDETLIARMGMDKKVRGGRLRLILPTGPSTAGVFAEVEPAAIRAGWLSIRS